MTVITGFEPFGGREDNASWQVAHRVADDLAREGIQIHAVQLPVEFDAIGPFIAHHREETVVSIGEAAVAQRARLEVAGRLWQHGTDNTGEYFNRPLASSLLPMDEGELLQQVDWSVTQSTGQPPVEKARRRAGSCVRVLYDGPTPPPAVTGDAGLEYAVSAPEDVVQCAREAGLAISNDAGLYICNTTTALGYGHLRRFAFIHVPAQPPTAATVDAVGTFVRKLIYSAHGGAHEV